MYTYPTGNVPLLITNTSDTPVCHFSVISRKDHVTSWDPLSQHNPPKEVSGTYRAPAEPKTQIAPGASLTINVDPDTYEFDAGSCDFTWTGSVSAVVVAGPTAVDVGAVHAGAAQAPSANVPAGYQRVAIMMRVPPPPSVEACIPNGEWRDSEYAVCCAGEAVHHYSAAVNREVCGP